MSYYFTSIGYYLSSIIPGAARNFHGDERYLVNNIASLVTITQEQVQNALKSLKPIPNNIEKYKETFNDYIQTHPKWNIYGERRMCTLYEIVSRDIKQHELNDSDKQFYETTKILRKYNQQVRRKAQTLKQLINLYQ